MTGMRIRLLIVTDEMEVGGSQRQIVQLLRHIDRDRFEPTVAFFRKPSFLVDELRALDIPVVHAPKRGRLDAAFALRFARFVCRGRFDVVHCYAFSGELWGALAQVLAGHGRLVTSIRGKYEWYRPWQWRIKRWVTRQSAWVVSNSRAGADYAMRRMGEDHGNVVVVPNGVTPPAPISEARRRTLRECLGVADGDALGLFVGRFVDHKNLPSLVEATARLAERRDDFKIALAGDGPLRSEVEAAIRTHGLAERMPLLGEVDNPGEWLQAADFLVLPSLREGLSNTVMEAMAAGRPTVASRVGGNPELITSGETGLLYPGGNVTALADAMARLMDDPPCARRLGEAARRQALSQFTPEALARRMEELYAAAVRDPLSGAMHPRQGTSTS